jgi:hypothetical protein
MDTEKSYQAEVPIDVEAAKDIDKRDIDQTPYEKALKEKQLGLKWDRPYGLRGMARPLSDRHVISLCELIHWIAFSDAVSVPDLETHFGGSLAPMNWPYMLWKHALQNVAEKIDRASEELFAEVIAGRVILWGLSKRPLQQDLKFHSTSISADVFAGPVTVELETNAIVLDPRRIGTENREAYAGSEWRDVTAQREKCIFIWPNHGADKCKPSVPPRVASNLDGKMPPNPLPVPPQLNHDAQAINSVKRANPQKDCKAWLIDRMRTDPVSRGPAKASVWNDAFARFDGLTKAAFKRVWAEAIETTNSNWGKPGRKTGSLQSEKIGSANRSG